MLHLCLLQMCYKLIHKKLTSMPKILHVSQAISTQYSRATERSPDSTSICFA